MPTAPVICAPQRERFSANHKVVIGIAIPAHNEQDHIAQRVQNALEASNNPRRQGEVVEVIVGADACTDATICHAERVGALTLSV